MTLVRKQCQGQCQQVKMIPENHTHCDRCWHKVMRQQHREARQRAWDAGYERGYEAGYAAGEREHAH